MIPPINGVKCLNGVQLYTPDVCGNCQHWHPIPKTADTLGLPPMGECRERIHLIAFPTRNELSLRTLYPAVPDSFPACSWYHPKPVESTENASTIKLGD